MTQFYGHVLAHVELKYGDSCPDTQTLACDIKFQHDNYESDQTEARIKFLCWL